ncbi:nucleic acid-binding, OB-fold protein [Artemisia annua]|uniref:Nucleic acid-binding, OB-fold protein n=1 Tax=Artemisia annua TaxID=35608 RepID=A0A2U1LHA5_ARTAN|nr:nucleic acid-binding, OB-fold protein [Artemisia annua]
MDLRPRDRNRVLEAKVYRAWIARDPPDTNEKSSGPADTIGNPNKDHMVMRKVEIQNLNRISIELTLRDDLAATFKKDDIDMLERPILIAVSSCRVSRFRNNLQLSSTPASYYYINPRIPQLEEYRAQYREVFNLKPPLEIGVRFTCEGTITSIHTSKDWYYPSCTTCTLKVQYDDGIYDCKIHGALAYPAHRYNFKASLTDGTATTTITFFTPKANDIVGIDCPSLLASLNNPDPRNVPEKIQAIVGKKHIFQFIFNTSSKQPTPEFIFIGLLDQPETPKQLADKASGSGTSEKQYDKMSEDIPQSQELVAAIEYPLTQPASMMTETPLPTVTQGLPTMQAPCEDINKDIPLHQQPVAATEYTFTLPRAIKTEALSPTETQGEKAMESPQHNPADQPNDPANTPPQEEEYLTDAPSKSSMANTGKPTTSKRALFQGKTAGTKQNKKE